MVVYLGRSAALSRVNNDVTWRDGNFVAVHVRWKGSWKWKIEEVRGLKWRATLYRGTRPWHKHDVGTSGAITCEHASKKRTMKKRRRSEGPLGRRMVNFSLLPDTFYVRENDGGTRVWNWNTSTDRTADPFSPATFQGLGGLRVDDA